MKYCKGCNETKTKQEFSNNKNNKDGLARVCRNCAAKYYQNFKKNQVEKYGKGGFNEIIFKKRLKKEAERNNIPIKGLSEEKLKNKKIRLCHYPDRHLPASLSHIEFMLKYEMTYEEYLFLRKSVKEGNFKIEARP